MSDFAFYITDVGIAAANAANLGGPKIDINTFSVGSAVNYVPNSTTDTALRGSILYTGSIADYRIDNNNQVTYTVRMDANIGTFDFGEVGLYLSTGELFALSSFTLMQQKIASSVGTPGNVITFEARCVLSNAAAAIIFPIENVVYSKIPELANLTLLPPAYDAQYSNAYSIQSGDENSNACIALRNSGALTWSLSTHTLRAMGSTVDSATTTSVTDDLIGNIISGNFAPRRHIIEFMDGALQSVCRYVTSSETGVVHFDAVASVPATGVTYRIWQSNISVVSGLAYTMPADLAASPAIGVATEAARADHVHRAQLNIAGNAATATNAESVEWAGVRHTPTTVGGYGITNINQYAPTMQGLGAEGNWGIDIQGTAAKAAKLATARSISATGDASWTTSFDGSANVTAVLTLADTGVTPGNYTNANIQVDAKGRVMSVVSGSGGSGSSAPLGGLSIPDFTLDHSIATGRTEPYATNPAGWNTGAGRCTADMQFVCNNYFTANPGGHFAIVLRQDPALVATAVRGQGVAIGNGTGFAYPSDQNPTVMPESWFNGFPGGNYLWPNAEPARNYKMSDGVTYRIIVDSTKTNEGNRYVRYRLWSLQSGVWRSEADSGDILDHNSWADLTQTAFMVGQVFESNLSTWSIACSNIKITWGPAENAVPDQSLKLARFGAQLEGNLTFIGDSRRVLVNNVGSNFTTMTAFQSKTANSNTTVLAVPNGTATASNFFATNSNSNTAYQSVSLGMNGVNGILETFNLGLGTAPLKVNIGGGNTVATFSTGGLTMAGASLPIGSYPMGVSGLLVNLGGYQATSFTASANLDVDSICTIGQLSAFMGATYSAGNIENVIRPLWCFLSTLIADLKSRKVI